MNIGIFLHFDYAMGGMLFNENRCYNEIFNNPAVDKIYVFDYKGKYSKMCWDFDFEYTRVIINSYADVEKFKKVDLLFTWDGYQDFFAGTISPKAVEIYKIISYFTNELDKKVVYRICDSRHFMRDYKHMIVQRKESDAKKKNAFALRNASNLHSLDDTKHLKYENCFFLCNGSRTVSDWSWKTLTGSMPFLSREFVQKKSIYLSDDILFRYTECFEANSQLKISDKIEKLYHVGNLNSGKVKMIRSAMKNSKIKLFLRTVFRSMNNGLRKIDSIELNEEGIFRDEMYKELNRYKAYLFVGKGDVSSCYFNKTLYDASIARTVFLIYGKIDSENIYSSLSEYVFNDEKELLEKFNSLTPENYQEHLDKQRKVLLDNLSTETIWPKILELPSPQGLVDEFGLHIPSWNTVPY